MGKNYSVMFKSRFFVSGLILTAILIPGCRDYDEKQTPPEQHEVVARYTGIPVVVDGVLDDLAWENAEVYNLLFSKDRDGEVEERGLAMVAWDSDYLYVGVKFYDSDIVALGEEDQLHHYRMGDLVEVFLKPAGRTYYWELYATPAGYKSHFFIPGRGRIPLGIEDYSMDLRVSARCAGTLNDWEDVDDYWTAEMAVPIADLIARGDEFAPGAEWSILIARHNFSRYLSNRELSMYPPMSRTNFHLHEEYAVLRLER